MIDSITDTLQRIEHRHTEGHNSCFDASLDDAKAALAQLAVVRDAAETIRSELDAMIHADRAAYLIEHRALLKSAQAILDVIGKEPQ